MNPWLYLIALLLSACATQQASTLTDAPSAAAPPVLLTSKNREAPTMSGGWGPHLRSILTMDDGKEWFAAEAGQDVNNNTVMAYYRRDPTGWKFVGSVALLAGIQQNMATISSGRFLYSYGVNVVKRWIVECWFDTKAPAFNLNTCNAMSTGTPISLAPESNYVGAAMRADGTRVVWWTKVGSRTTDGTFSYTYNHGGGWNGPVTSGLGGYNDVGYVHARFDAAGRLRALGQLWLGLYPGGSPHAAVATIKLGSVVQWSPIIGATSSTDLWHDRASGTTHVLAAIPGGVAYYVAKADKWPALGMRVATFLGAYRMRFAAAGTDLMLVRDDIQLNKVVVYLAPGAALAEPVPWTTMPVTQHLRAGATSGQPLSAIWTVDPSKERRAATTRGFATGGAYPSKDHEIWHYP